MEKLQRIKRIDSISVFLIILGLLCVTQATKALVDYYSIKDWKVVTGSIISAQDIAQGESLYDGKGPALLVKIETVAYAYKVEYRAYKGVGYTKGSETPSPGTSVAVYYNPDDPKLSTIDPTLDWAYLLTWIILSVSVFAAEYFWFKLRVKHRPRKPFRKQAP